MRALDYIGDFSVAKIGDFSFSVKTLDPESIDRKITYPWQKVSALNGDKHQFIGREKDEITIRGTLIGGYGDLKSLRELQELAARGEPQPLVLASEDSGKALGLYVITTLTSESSYFSLFGDPKRLAFTITLERHIY